jgi:dipeptidyl aminopeptidase/acylaminoacyl peptidase
MSVRRITHIRAGQVICTLSVAILLSAPFLPAQEKLSFRIDDEVTRFAFSGDGRIAYAVRHVFSEKKIQLQRDDIWIADRDGKKRRILQGEKFVHGAGPFSYLVRELRWSPDNTKLAVELATSEMINEDGETREGMMTLLLDDSGTEIQIAGNDGLIPGATNAAWLADGVTVVYLTPAQSGAPPQWSERLPNDGKLFMTNRVRVTGEADKTNFRSEIVSAVAWNAFKSSGVAIRHNHISAPLPNTPADVLPAHLYALDLIKEKVRELATLDGYAGGLSISPSGDKVAYWVGKEQLEVSDVASNRITRVRVVLGILGWAGDEKRVLVKQGAASKSGSLVWISLPQFVTVADGNPPTTQIVSLQSILHDLEFRQFDISPDGKSLAVVEPGRRNLLVYSLP